MTFLLRLWPYLAASALVIGAGVWINRLGYESGYNASEAHWKPLFAAADTARAVAEARTDTREAQSKLITFRREAEHAEVVSSLTLRADAADQRLRTLSMRFASNPATSRCEVPAVPGGEHADAGATERERRAAEAGSSIAGVGRDCGKDAARVEFWNSWYAEQRALSTTAAPKD